jgi:hypothetical protein
MGRRSVAPSPHPPLTPSLFPAAMSSPENAGIISRLGRLLADDRTTLLSPSALSASPAACKADFVAPPPVSPFPAEASHKPDAQAKDQTPRTVATAIASDLAQIMARKPALHEATSQPPVKASVQAAAKRPASRAEVVEAFRRDELRPLWLGRAAFQWIEDKADRVAELRALKADLCKADLVPAAARLDRFICYYWIAQRLGWDDAQQLRVAAIREMAPLFGRNAATEEWGVRKTYEADARILWRVMINKRLPASAVRDQVRKIRPRSGLKIDKPAREFAKLMKSIRRIDADVDQLYEIIRICQDRLANWPGATSGTEAA